MYPQVFGKYVLERELARGGMARVMLATLRGAGGFEKKLVVKQIRDELASDDEFVRRFVEEAKTTVALAHPNIVPVYELGVELGTYFLAMELVSGASVAELLRGGPPLTPEEGAYVGVEVCRALDYAHRRVGVVHRDVTPRNVMIDEEGQVKVIDFGIAARVVPTAVPHGVFGSPGHMPPEQLRGGELTPATDVFAVATLLLEAWSGQAPFRRATLAETEAALTVPPGPPSTFDVRLLPLDETIARAVALDPSARPQQADDLGRALRRFLAGVDLGDLARKLGERVRAYRARTRSSALDAPDALDRTSPDHAVASAPAIATRTFAARADVIRAARGFEPATRRLTSSRPLTDAGTESAWRKPAFGVGAGILGGLLIALVTRGPARATGSAPAPDPWVAASATAPSFDVAPHPPDSMPQPSSNREVPYSAPATDASVPLGPAAPAPAQLALIGEGALVRVDGVAHGSCPARVALDPGPHSVVFTYPATGESKEHRLRLAPGERVTLQADFTTAAPTVRLVR